MLAINNPNWEDIVRAVRSLDPIEGLKGKPGETPPCKMVWLLRHVPQKDERRGGYRIILTVRAGEVNGTCPMDPRRAGTSCAEVGEGLRARTKYDVPGAWRHGGHSQFISVAVGGFPTEAAARNALEVAASILYPEEHEQAVAIARLKVQREKERQEAIQTAEALAATLPAIAAQARAHGWNTIIDGSHLGVYGGEDLDNIPAEAVDNSNMLGRWGTRGDGKWYRIIRTPDAKPQHRTLPPWMPDPERTWQHSIKNSATALGWECSFDADPKNASIQTYPDDEFGSPHRKRLYTSDSGVSWGEGYQKTLSWNDVLNIKASKPIVSGKPAQNATLAALAAKFKKNPKPGAASMSRRFPPILQETYEARKADPSRPFASLKHVEFSPVRAVPPITPKTLICKGLCQLAVGFNGHYKDDTMQVTYKVILTSPTWEDAGAFVDHILHKYHKDNSHIFMEDIRRSGTANDYSTSKVKVIPAFEIWMGS